MIKSINNNEKLGEETTQKLEKRLALELEQRTELETCTSGYCKGVHW